MDASVYACYTKSYISPEAKHDDSVMRSPERRAAVALGVGDARRGDKPMTREDTERLVQKMVHDPTLTTTEKIERHLVALRDLAVFCSNGTDVLSVEWCGSALSFSMKPMETPDVA
jgi:hypothetical protein